ncbi:MAG: MFS transporter [Chitinophagaceae bacterium]|nr:MFS transporter [Chitinophagaceae bacterium]
MTNTVNSDQPVSGIPAALKYFMAVSCGIMVANLYYCQPLLGDFVEIFGVQENAAAWINICSQLGYGLGLFFIVPVGDMVPRRNLLVWMHIMAALSVAGAAISQNIGMIYFFSVCIGLTATACQVFVPLGAHLASEEERGKVIGTIMGGLLSGILLSRTLSGLAADLWGWRSVYWIACGLMLVMAALVHRMIPGEEPGFKGNYRVLMISLLRLIRSQSIVRESAWIGACTFGAISAFWSTMAFFLEKPPFDYSVSVIGLFGIVGLAGALVSPFVGTLNDKKGPYLPIKAGILIMIAGYALMFYGHLSIWIVVIGIILIDVGLQSAHVPNITRVSSLYTRARTRLNTIYMTAFFIGGTLGSILGSYAWDMYGWSGVCGVGILFSLLGGLPVVFGKNRHAE